MSGRSAFWSVVGGATVACAIGVGVYVAAIRPWHRRWGASDKEIAESMPGDDLVPNANFNTTRAINIAAPPGEVWPWLVQIGQGRAGFYSYDVLENSLGLGIHSANRILPQFQGLRVGDTIPLEPEGGGYTVAEIEPDHHLVLFTDGSGDAELDRVFRQANAASTWTFLLKESAAERTRLIVRWRARWERLRSPVPFLIGLFLGPVEFIMERRMMRGIKERVEALRTLSANSGSES